MIITTTQQHVQSTKMAAPRAALGVRGGDGSLCIYIYIYIYIFVYTHIYTHT